MLIMVNDVNSHIREQYLKFYKLNAFSLCVTVILCFFIISLPIALFNTFGRFIHRFFYIGSNLITISSMKTIFFLQVWCRCTGSVDIKIPKTERPIIFVANHRSNLDVFTFIANIRGIRVVAKKGLFKVPGLSMGMKLFRQIKFSIIKGAGVNESLEVIYNPIKNGERVLMFPEMTRCSYGFEGVQKFSSIPFQIAKNLDALVVPIICVNTDRVWPKGELGISFRERFSVFSIDPIDSRKFQTTREFKKLTREMMLNALNSGEKQLGIG